MMNRIHLTGMILVALACAALVGAGAGAGSGAGEAKFAAAPALLEARSGACAALLGDGRVLVTGGEGPDGVLATAEILGAGPETAPPMAFARAGHVCVALADGTVLVAGGRSAGGGETNAAEIFDPAADAWRIIAPMNAARYGATASLLSDGRVLIAGGEASGLALATLEIYDPGSGRFEPVPGAMSTPRKEHAAAVLADGRVLLAGGSNGEAALDTVEVFDPATGELSLIGAMSAARAGLSATTLLGGRVLLAGGNNGETDLATAEIYDPAAGRFFSAAAMPAARRGQIALRLPDNNQVLILGGTSGGRLLADAVLYVPWRDVFEPAGKLLEARTAAVVTSLSGKVIVAGGRTLAAAATSTRETLTYPTIRTTDAAGVTQSDFSPGETVYIRGENWTPGATVVLKVDEVSPGSGVRWGPTEVIAASDGRLASSFALTAEDAYKTFALTASEPSTGREAQVWTFTDAPKVGSVTVGAQSPNPVTAGSSATYTITVNRGSGPGSPGSFTANLSITTPLPTGATASFSPNPVSFDPGDSSKTSTLTITTTGSTPAGSHSFTVKADTSASDFATGNGTLNVQAACVAPSITTHPVSATKLVGESVTFSVTATGTAPLSYQWRKNGSSISGATGSSYTIASVTMGDAGSYDVVVTNGCGSATSNAAVLTVNKANTTTTIISDTPDPSVVGQSYTVSWSVTVNSPGAGTPTGIVTVSDGNGGSCSAAVAAGSCSLTSTSAGAKTLTATYSGDDNFNGSSGTAPHQVDKANTTTTITSDTPDPSVVGQSYTVSWSVTVNSPGAGTPTGTVTVSDGNGGSCSAAVAAGSCSLTSTSAGAKTLTATYSGDGNFNGSSGTAPHQVDKANTSISVTSSANPSVFNQTVTFTATVTVAPPGAGTPTGTVNFKDNGTTIGSGTLNGGGVATFATSALAVGSHSITAEYMGDSNFNGSTSPALTQVVNKRNTSTVVSVVPGTVNEGQPATVTVVVTDVESLGTKVDPAGTVSFGSSSTDVTLSGSSCNLTGGGNGTASCSVTLTALDGPSTPTITATYSGSGIHSGSINGAGLTVNNVAPTIGSITGPVDPVKVGVSTSVTVNFTDPGVLDTHTCTFDWDDTTTSPGTVSENNGTGSCTGTRTYQAAGVYTVTVTVRDKDGDSATGQYNMFIVVYDPNAGFVTGGGWINSPTGAYQADQSLTGKASFGFVSKYQKGATVPTGNTEFQFHVAKFNFSSTSYQWLVVSGAKAQYKGTGTVNGQPGYGFLLTATDGQLQGGGGVDKFRIKIWDSNGIVYDNKFGAADDADPQEIAGGSIVIHSK
jgi:hypothetical protein